MQEISRGEDWTFEYYSGTSKNLVPSKYVETATYGDGYIVFQSATWSMWFLTQDEYNNMAEYDAMRKYKFVVPEDENEKEIARAIYLRRSQRGNQPPSKEKIKGCTIFTTNICNARCPYCYEKNNLPMISMTEDTAKKVLEYLKSVAAPPIRIVWFGGEPLINTKVIDIICGGLKEAEINFSSVIITNGYLLDDEIVNKCYNEWNTTTLQISIDGIGKRYNAIKNYKNNDPDAFQKVIGNIRHITSLGKQVHIRVNVGEDNVDNIAELLAYFRDNFTKELKERRIVVKLAMLFEIQTCSIVPSDEFFNKCEMFYRDFPTVVNRKNSINILKKHRFSHCMADGYGVSINPQGYLSPCEHWHDENIIGHVSSGITDTDKIMEWWRKDGENIEFCEKMECPMLPACDHWYKCEALPMCGDEKYEKTRAHHKNLLISTYKYWLKKKAEYEANKKSEE